MYVYHVHAVLMEARRGHQLGLEELELKTVVSSKYSDLKPSLQHSGPTS